MQTKHYYTIHGIYLIIFTYLIAVSLILTLNGMSKYFQDLKTNANKINIYTR